MSEENGLEAVGVYVKVEVWGQSWPKAFWRTLSERGNFGVNYPPAIIGNSFGFIVVLRMPTCKLYFLILLEHFLTLRELEKITRDQLFLHLV